MNELWTFGNLSSIEHNKYIYGNGSITAAVYLVDSAYQSGARVLFLAPVFDYQAGIRENLLRIERVRELIYLCKERYPGMKIAMGSCIRYFDGVIRSLKQGSVFSLADSRYLLYEFEQDAEFGFIRNGVRQCFEAGFRPIISGITLLQEITSASQVEDLIQDGAFIQLTIGQIMGKIQRKKKKLVEELLEKDLIHLLNQPDLVADLPSTHAMFIEFEKRYGEEKTQKIVWQNYRNILEDRLLEH